MHTHIHTVKQTYTYIQIQAHTHTHLLKYTDIQTHTDPQTYSGLEKNSKEKNQGPETTRLNILNEQLTFEQSKRWQLL